MKITQKTAKKLFNYRDDGVLVWKLGRGPVKKGRVAGCLNHDGYYMIGINGKIYKRSRLVWLWHNGYMPENQIDHINRNPSSDRIENLREVSSQCNQRNCGNHKDNTSGVKGVCFDRNRKKWMAHIRIMKKYYNLGRYADFDEAVLARLATEQCLGWEGCDSSSPAYQYAKKYNLIKAREFPK